MNAPKPRTILIVDDEPKALLFLRNLIEPEGYRVLTAASGAVALDLARQELPDVALLDVMMPEMDGFELCRLLRAEPRLQHMPLLMLTALDDRASRLQGLEAGADDFLSKPLDSTELRIRLRTITRLNRFRLLFEERARFEAAVAFSPDAIVLTEEDGRILLANPAFKRLLIDAENLEQNLFGYLPAAALEEIRATLAAPPRDGPPHMIETPLDHARHPDATVEIAVSRLTWEARTVLQFNLRDITEKKQLEAQLLRSQRIEVLGQLAGGIVHDANNIFTAIMGSASLLQMGDPARAPVHINNILASGRRGANLLRQLLMFARGADGELEPVSPGAVAAEISSVVRETFGGHFQIHFESPADLPAILADSTQLHQILMNLCVNARDAMPDGGDITLSARLATLSAEAAHALDPSARAGDYVVLSVRDTGTGIPPEVRAKLFDPFFTTKPKDKGTGLGLATVLRLVKRHGGFVALDTEVGKGTCFACHFPVTPPATAT